MRNAELECLVQAPSVWQASLTCQPRWLHSLPFNSDVVIIGAGIGGLSAALHALREGYSVTVLEARQLGAGASGRNSGFVVPVPSRHSPASLQSLLGDSAGPFVRALQRTANMCLSTEGPNVTRHGWAQPFPEVDQETLKRNTQQWQALGIEAECVEGDQLFDLIGTGYYQAGLLFKGGGGIDPYTLLQHLATAVTLKGGCIVEECSALRTSVGSRGVTVHTEQGDIRAERVLIAGNAYGVEASRTTQQPIGRIGLALATFPVEQLPEEVVHVPFSDARKDMWFCRRLKGNLLMTGAFILPGTGTIAKTTLLMRQRIEFLYGRYPSEPENLWAGFVGLTRTGMPIVRSEHPRLIHWSGCNGRGIALSTLMGERLIDHLFGKATLSLPSTGLNLPTLTQWLAHSLILLDRRRQKNAPTPRVLTHHTERTI